MSNGGETPAKPNGNGLGGVLITLAKGDKSVQVLVAIILVINTWMTNNNGKTINRTDKNLTQFQKAVARQIKSMYDNQNFMFDFVDEVRGSQDRIQTKLEIPHPAS